MKILLINFLVFLLFTPCFAQTEGILNYKLSTKNTLGINEVNKSVYFKGAKSIEFGVARKIASSTKKISETEHHEVRVITSKKKPFIYKDLSKHKLLLSENIVNKIFLISDSVHNFKWKISPEHKKILNYNCTKAVVNFRGRAYTAWFAEKIPLQFGPWKFGGLPGLIIKVSDSEEKFVYELTGINLKEKVNQDLLNVPEDYKDDKPISHSDFITIYKKKLADYAKMSKVVHPFPNGGTGTATITLPEKQEKF